MLMAAAAVNGAKARCSDNFRWIVFNLQFRMPESQTKTEIVPMPLPPRPEDTDRARLVDYIRAMTLELAVLADRAGQPALGDYLRAAPSKVDWPDRRPQ